MVQYQKKIHGENHTSVFQTSQQIFGILGLGAWVKPLRFAITIIKTETLGTTFPEPHQLREPGGKIDGPKQ